MRGRPDPRRVVLACLAALALLCCAAGGQGVAGQIEVEARPVQPEWTGEPRVGGLLFLGGFDLSSDDPRFGGLSGLDVSPDGARLYAVSDQGYWITANLAHDADGRLAAAGSWRSVPLLTPRGHTVNLLQQDAEGLVRNPDGSFLVSFEGAHRIWRYPSDLSTPPRPMPTPLGLAKAPFNRGLEAITVLADGTVFGVTEDQDNEDDSLKGWLMKNGVAQAVSYVPADGFSPTGLATLPDGDVLLLERQFDLVRKHARVVRIEKAALTAGAQVRGGAVADLRRPLPLDNFEGLAVRRDAEGQTLLYLVSDDNFLPFQRTLLLQFRLSE